MTRYNRCNFLHTNVASYICMCGRHGPGALLRARRVWTWQVRMAEGDAGGNFAGLDQGERARPSQSDAESGAASSQPARAWGLGSSRAVRVAARRRASWRNPRDLDWICFDRSWTWDRIYVCVVSVLAGPRLAITT